MERSTRAAAAERIPDAPPSGVAFVPLDTPLERLVGLAVRPHEGAGSVARTFLELARLRVAELNHPGLPGVSVV